VHGFNESHVGQAQRYNFNIYRVSMTLQHNVWSWASRFSSSTVVSRHLAAQKETQAWIHT